MRRGECVSELPERGMSRYKANVPSGLGMSFVAEVVAGAAAVVVTVRDDEATAEAEMALIDLASILKDVMCRRV